MESSLWEGGSSSCHLSFNLCIDSGPRHSPELLGSLWLRRWIAQRLFQSDGGTGTGGKQLQPIPSIAFQSRCWDSVGDLERGYWRMIKEGLQVLQVIGLPCNISIYIRTDQVAWCLYWTTGFWVDTPGATSSSHHHLNHLDPFRGIEQYCCAWLCACSTPFEPFESKRFSNKWW